jgi:hypothetical protein
MVSQWAASERVRPVSVQAGNDLIGCDKDLFGSPGIARMRYFAGQSWKKDQFLPLSSGSE